MTRPAILFVCLGNICRSPLAEAAFRARAEEAGLDVMADSAGTADYHVGKSPDPRSVAEAARHGIDIGEYRGRQLAPKDFSRFSMIFGMDHENVSNIEKCHPGGSTTPVALLMDAVEGREGAAIADPYYDGEERFADTWADVDAAAIALVERLRD